MTRTGDQCWQSGDNADPVNRTHGRADPSNAVPSHEELYTPAQRLNWRTSYLDKQTSSLNPRPS